MLTESSPTEPPTPRAAARAELARWLRTAIRHDTPGCPQTMVISAGPGAGKTYTLHALLADITTAADAEVTARFAGADELSWRRPYAVAATLLDVELPAPIPEEFDDELYARVDDLCSSGPVVLAVDDAHHADAATLSLIIRLAGATHDLPLTLLVGRRQLPVRDSLTRLLARPGVAERHLPLMTADEVLAVAREVVGAEPDASVRSALERAGGNPMVAVSLLRSMRQAGGLVVADGIVSTVLLADADQRVAGEHDAIAEHLTLLDPDALALVRALAVWGRPATPAALARLIGSRPAALVGSAQAAIDAGILVARDDATLAFTHDLYADVAYARLAPPLRAVLHRAIAEHPDVADDHPSIAHHLLAAGADPAEVDAAVRRAEGELEFAPGVAADLLDTVAERAQNAGVRPGLHVDLAVALTRTGQLNRAAVVAEEGIAAASDLDEIANLHRILMFALTTKGKTDRVRELIDLTVQFPIGDDAVEVLTDLRAYVGILDGSAPVPRQPLFDTDAQVRSLGGVIGESLRRYVRGDLPEALRLSLIAARRQAVEDVADPGSVPTNSSAEIWPALIEQALHGPRAAADLLATSTAQRTRRGAEWMAAYHDFTRGSIELGLGHLGDAAAAWDTGLDRVASADMGWTSMAIGGRILVDVLCGDLAAATLRLDDWDAGGLPEQFGLPVVGRARAQLFEASRKPRRASAAAATVWDRAVHQGLDVMLPEYSVDCARIAVRANDAVLLGRIVDGLDAMQFAPSPAMAPLALLGRTRAAATLGVADESEVLDAAVVAADAMTSIGHALAAVLAAEEAACAAMTLGDRATARDWAHRALAGAHAMSAPTVATRIASRMRALGLRLDPAALRERPRSGWESLTRTEVTVAELVAAGLSGAEIADRLVISTRTVQTHVSHALTKLELRTRVELAGYVVRQRHRDAST